MMTEIGLKKPDPSLLDEGYVFVGKSPDGFYVYYNETPKNTKFGYKKRDKNGHLEDFSCCTDLELIPKKDKNAPVSPDWLG